MSAASARFSNYTADQGCEQVPQTGDIILLLTWVHACQGGGARHQLRRRDGGACLEKRSWIFFQVLHLPSSSASSTSHRHHRQHRPHLAAGLHIRLPSPPLLLSSYFSHRHTLAVAALVRALVSVEIPVDVEILSSWSKRRNQQRNVGNHSYT